jgi:hypothetical protein
LLEGMRVSDYDAGQLLTPPRTSARSDFNDFPRTSLLVSQSKVLSLNHALTCAHRDLRHVELPPLRRRECRRRLRKVRSILGRRARTEGSRSVRQIHVQGRRLKSTTLPVPWKCRIVTPDAIPTAEVRCG